MCFPEIQGNDRVERRAVYQLGDKNPHGYSTEFLKELEYRRPETGRDLTGMTYRNTGLPRPR